MPASPCSGGRPVMAAAAQTLARVEAAHVRVSARRSGAGGGRGGSAEGMGTARAWRMAGDGEGGRCTGGGRGVDRLGFEWRRRRTEQIWQVGPMCQYSARWTDGWGKWASVEPSELFYSAVKLSIRWTGGLLFSCIGAVEWGFVKEGNFLQHRMNRWIEMQ
jgi:hypothetical protein